MNLSNTKESKLHFGMPTLIELNSLKENVELCKKLKLNFIELNMNIPLFSVLGIEDENNFELKKIIEELNFYQKEFGIYFTIHLDENFNFADSNIYIKNAYLKTLKAVIKNSKKINCPIINMHLNKGIYFTLPTEKVFLFEKYKEEFNNSLEEFIKFCNCENSDSNIFISIENTDGWTDFEKKSIEKILMNKNFSLTFDIGHSQAIGNIDQDFILKNKSKLKHFHIHDGTLPNAATKQFGKNHLQLGTGNINLKEKIYLAKETNSRCVIETKTVDTLKKSVSYLKNYLC